MPIGGRDLRGRGAVGRHGHKARLHQRTLAVRVASNEKIGWWSLVPAWTRVQEGSFAFLDSAFDTTDHVVAVSERSEPIVAVRDDIHDGYGLRLLSL